MHILVQQGKHLTICFWTLMFICLVEQLWAKGWRNENYTQGRKVTRWRRKCQGIFCIDLYFYSFPKLQGEKQNEQEIYNCQDPYKEESYSHREEKALYILDESQETREFDCPVFRIGKLKTLIDIKLSSKEISLEKQVIIN